MINRGRGRGLMSLPSPPLSRKSSSPNIANSASRVAVVSPVQSSHTNVNVPTELVKPVEVKSVEVKPVEKKPTVSKPNLDATAQNPGWGDSEITNLLKRRQKKEPVSAKVDIKAAAVTPAENKQVVSDEQKSSEAISQNLNGIAITDVHKQRTAKVELVGKDTAKAATINAEDNSLIPPPEEDESGWGSFDIRALLSRKKSRSSTTKTSTSGYYSNNTKSLGDTSSEAKDNSTVIAVVRCPFKGNTKLQEDVSKIVEINNNVVSSAVKVNSKVEAEQSVSKEPILPKSKSEVIPVGRSESKDDVKTATEISHVQSNMSSASKGLKNGVEMTRSIEFTKDELHEFHGLFKSCSESFDKLSKFFLKVGGHC